MPGKAHPILMNGLRENIGAGDARLRRTLAFGLLLGSFVLLATSFGATELMLAALALLTAIVLVRSARSRRSLVYRLLGLDTSEYARMPADDRPDWL